jgi:hypothetical protein
MAHDPYPLGVEESLVGRVDEQNILRLEIRVRQAVVVQKLHSEAQLISNVAHMVHGVRMELVLLLQFTSRERESLYFRNVPRLEHPHPRSDSIILARKSKTDSPSISKPKHIWP